MGKKIFYINPMSYNNSALYDYYLLTNIKDPKFKIFFFGSKQYNANAIDNVVCKYVFNYKSNQNNALKALSYVLSYIKITFFVLFIRPSCIHIQWLKIPYVDLLFLKLWKFLNSKIILTAHNILPHNDNSKNTKEAYVKIYRTINKIILHTENSKKDLLELDEFISDKIKVIPHGIIKMPCNENKVTKIQDTYQKVLKDKIVFSSLGLQSPYKGIGNIIKAWIKTPELSKRDNLHLLIAGSSDNVDYSELTKYCKNVTIIDRRLSDEEYIAFTRLSSVILLPYVKISQSGVLLSAIAEGVPVLVSEAGGLSEPLKIANIGWNIGKSTPQSISETLLNIVNNYTDIYAIKNNMKIWKKVQDFYSWERSGKLTLDLYSSLIDNNDNKK